MIILAAARSIVIPFETIVAPRRDPQVNRHLHDQRHGRDARIGSVDRHEHHGNITEASRRHHGGITEASRAASRVRRLAMGGGMSVTRGACRRPAPHGGSPADIRRLTVAAAEISSVCSRRYTRP